MTTPRKHPGGRPRATPAIPVHDLVAMRAGGFSWSVLAQEAGVSARTVKRLVQGAAKLASDPGRGEEAA